MTEQAAPIAPPESGVKVRMYRVGGLGDCFLLTFPSNSGDARYMLIDCGVFFGTPGGADRIRAVARDLRTATGGRIHALVATHQHYDHLSGFKLAQEVFDEIQVDETWVAWTENPNHPLARKLRDNRAFALRALDQAVARMTALNDPNAALIAEVMNFNGGFDRALGLSGTAGQMEYVLGKGSSTRYLRPADPPITWADSPGIRIFALGPPEDEVLLTHSEPTGAKGEVYELPGAVNESSAFCAAVLAAGDLGAGETSFDELFDRSLPFDYSVAIPLDQAANHPDYGSFFHQYYGFSDQEGDGPGWRRIDTDWLSSAANLALQLDNNTNNTSLVLAIELSPGGKTLLFPGDAQVGNWLSWSQLSWTDSDGKEVTGVDLLQRAALYKVGHHGSHNATLRAKGLELMLRNDLVAMIPVYQDQADKKHWAMPFSPLLQRLEEKTSYRILRNDLGMPERPDSVPADRWYEFTCCVSEDSGPDKLWIEFTVSP